MTKLTLILMVLLSSLSLSIDVSANELLPLINQEQTVSEPVDKEESNSPIEIDVVETLHLEELIDTTGKTIDNLFESSGFNTTVMTKVFSSLGIFILAYVLFRVIRHLINLGFIVLDKKSDQIYLDQSRLRLYRRILYFFTILLIAALISIIFTALWSDTNDNWFMNETVATIFAELFNFFVVVIISIFFFELISSVVEGYIRQLSKNSSSRVNTLLPIVRNLVYGTLILMLGLMLLSQLGIDIVPLLAGAGVVGFAVGFGAQTLIKDLITGFIIIIEDLIQVGDIATLGDKTGLIEKITIRKVQLRDLSGVVYTVPFSEISVVENLTKDFSYYMMDIGIAYKEDPDEVIGLLQQISSEMEQDAPYKNYILEPIEVFGVDQFADSAIYIKARIKTLPMKQWETGREFNRRMKHLFDQRNIEIPFPHQTIYFGENKDGSSPAARVLIDKKEKENKLTQQVDNSTQSKKLILKPKGPQQPSTEDEDSDS